MNKKNHSVKMNHLAFIALIFIGFLGVSNGMVSTTASLKYSQCAASTPADLAPAITACNEAITYSSAFSNTWFVFLSMSVDLNNVAFSPDVINSQFLLPSSMAASNIITQLNQMIVFLNSTTDTCSSFNSAAVTVIQSNITGIKQQLNTIKVVVQKAGPGCLILMNCLDDTTVNLLTQTVQSYNKVIVVLVVACRDAVVQNPIVMYLHEYYLAYYQSSINAALAAFVTFYNVVVVPFMTSLQITIAAANATCNAMNTTTEAQINLTITTCNATMNSSAIFLPPPQQAAIANYTYLTIITMIKMEIEVITNVTDAAANYSSFCGNNITAAMQNITDMGRSATINITQIMNSTSNVLAYSCASTVFTQIQLVVSKASDYLGKCVTDGVQELKNDTDECVKAYKDKSKNATDSCKTCTKPGSHEKTDDEFKKCLEDNSDSDCKDLKDKLHEKSKKMEKGGDNEKKVKKCKENIEDDSYYKLIALVVQYQQCVAIIV